MALTNCTETEKVVMKRMTAATTIADSYTGFTDCGVLLLVSYPLESIASSRLLYEVGLLVLLPLYNAERLRNLPKFHGILSGGGWLSN